MGVKKMKKIYLL